MPGFYPAGTQQLALGDPGNTCVASASIEYVIDGDREYRHLERSLTAPTNVTTGMLSRLHTR